MGKIQKRSPCNIHSSCLVCFMNEKQFWSSLSLRGERGRCSYQRETCLSSSRSCLFCFFYRKIAFRISLALPFAKTFNCHFLFRSRQSPQTYSSQNQLTHSPVGDPSTLNSCVSFFCPQWDSPQPKPMWTMLSRWPLQCKYYCLFSNLLFVGCWKELAADAEVATLVFDFVSTNL